MYPESLLFKADKTSSLNVTTIAEPSSGASVL